MPSSNVRYTSPKKRARALALVRQMVIDGSPCAICGLNIDLTLPKKWEDPRTGSLKLAPWSLECDEIIPVSCGGSPYEPDNIQPAHRFCNQWRGNKSMQQVAERRTELWRLLGSVDVPSSDTTPTANTTAQQGTTTRLW